MADFVKALSKIAGDRLEAGEEILAAMPVKPDTATGGVFRQSGQQALGLAGALLGAAVDRRMQKKRQGERDEEGADAPPPADVTVPDAGAIVGLTPRRILLFSRSGFDKPKEFLGAVAISDLHRVEREDVKGKLLAGKPKSARLVFHLKDGTAFRTEAVRSGPYGKQFARFMDRYAELGGTIEG